MKKFLVLFAIGCTLLLQSPAQASPWVEVSSDGDSYLVSGGALFHSRFEDDREEAATCTDCFWQVRRTCTNFDAFDRGPCPELLASCPNDMQIAEVERATSTTRPDWDSKKWKFISYTCIFESGPVSTREVTETIKQTVRLKVPALRVESVPPKRTLVHLPTRIRQISASEIRYSNIEVAGVKVKLWATSALHPTCGSCLRRGSSFSIQQTGRVAIQVDATWSAWYTALGIRPLKVPDPQIRQRKTLWIQVSELKSRFWKIGDQ
jgi:hypothetical protein